MVMMMMTFYFSFPSQQHNDLNSQFFILFYLTLANCLLIKFSSLDILQQQLLSVCSIQLKLTTFMKTAKVN